MRTFVVAESGRPGDQPVTYECDRVCAADNCETRISVYNPSSHCSLHDRAELVKKTRPADPKPVFERRCAYEKCGVLFLAANPKRVYCSDRCRAAVFEQRRVRATND